MPKTVRARKKPVVITASQWFMNGDHPQDYARPYADPLTGSVFPPEYQKTHDWEGQVVRRFRHPDVPGDSVCGHCKYTMYFHGWIDGMEDDYDVCPGDWIITSTQRDYFPCKPDVFKEDYEIVE